LEDQVMRLLEAVLLCTAIAAMPAAASAPATVSAASGASPVAPGSIVSIYGTNLASSTAGATSQPLPTSLADVEVKITDSAGVTANLPLFYVSPNQINAEIPSTAQSGQAQMTITTPSGPVSGPLTIAMVAPGLFSANATGKDVAVAQLVVANSDGPQTQNNIFQCGAGTISCVPLGLNLTAGPAALVLWGTGVRNVTDISKVTVQVGNLTLPVTYAGPAPGFTGLDQINVLLPASLAGTGIANISVSADGTVSNVLTASFGFATGAPACAGCTQYTNPPYTIASQGFGSCDVSSVAKAGPLAPSAWPYVNGEEVYVQQATSANVDQLYIADVASDGSLQNKTCLSCSSPPAPPIDRYKNSPSLRPQGDWILVRVEDADGPVINDSSTANQQVVRNNGYYADLWAVSLDGSQWYQLTQFTAPPGGDSGAHGILDPRWSPDGTMVAYSETYQAPDPANRQGYWHLLLANFSVDSKGVPSFSNTTDISLPGDVFYEVQAFSPDGSQLLVQSYTPGINAYGVDIYSVNLTPGPNFGHYTDLTNSPYTWDEHPVFSPDGQKIAWSSSLIFPNLIPEYGTLPWYQYRNYLHCEMFLMNSDGTNVEQLTSFNAQGVPQFADALFPTWNLAGTQIFVQSGGADLPVPGGNSAWLVNFQGNCGGTAQ
jgi:uncharacterized protein (TIGR03437 family)